MDRPPTEAELFAALDGFQGLRVESNQVAIVVRPKPFWVASTDTLLPPAVRIKIGPYVLNLLGDDIGWKDLRKDKPHG